MKNLEDELIKRGYQFIRVIEGEKKAFSKDFPKHMTLYVFLENEEITFNYILYAGLIIHQKDIDALQIEFNKLQNEVKELNELK